MNLNNIKLSFIRDSKKQAVEIIQKIQNTCQKYNISINKAITYLYPNSQSKYQKRILDICRAIYPYDGQINLTSIIEKNSDSQEKIKRIIRTQNFYDSKERISHEQDQEIKEKKVGIDPKDILQKDNINIKNKKIQSEVIDPKNLIKNTEKPKKLVTRKRKKRIQ